MKTWRWLKKWGGALFGGIAAVLLTVLSLGWYVRRKDAEIASLRGDREVTKALSEVKRLEAVRAEIVDRVGEKDEAIGVLDSQIREQRQRVLIVASAGDISDDELEERFREVLGG